MPAIQTGRFADLLRRYLQMKGDSDVGNELAPEVSAVLALESERPEWEFLKGAKLMAMQIFQAATVGLPSVVRLRNPAASGVVAVISDVHYSSNAAATGTVVISRATDQGNLATILGPITRDTRYEPTVNSALIGSSGTVFSGSNFYRQFTLSANPVQVSNFGFVLTPGHQIEISTLELNVALQGAFWWLEKRLDELERS